VSYGCSLLDKKQTQFKIYKKSLRDQNFLLNAWSYKHCATSVHACRSTRTCHQRWRKFLSGRWATHNTDRHAGISAHAPRTSRKLPATHRHTTIQWRRQGASPQVLRTKQAHV